MTLDDAIAALYVREINCGCETFWDGGIKVWIGDVMNGHRLVIMFNRGDMGRAEAVAGRRGRAATARQGPAELLGGTSTAPPASKPNRSVPMSSSAAASELGPH